MSAMLPALCFDIPVFSVLLLNSPFVMLCRNCSSCLSVVSTGISVAACGVCVCVRARACACVRVRVSYSLTDRLMA